MLLFADTIVRYLLDLGQILPLGLEASGLKAAAAAVRTLPEVVDGEAARRTMFALEKMARAHAAPELLVRAAHGSCACALSLALSAGRGGEAAVRPTAQLVSALVRLVTSTTKTGVAAEAVVQALAGVRGHSAEATTEC